MSLGPAEILLLVVAVALPVWGIVDAGTRPNSSWAAADQSKVVWGLVQILLWGLGSLVYFIAIRPKLKAVTSGSVHRPLEPGA